MKRIVAFSGATLALLSVLPIFAQTSSANSTDLEKGFANPPLGARPRVWWHWMDGNVTPEGIALDLKWMEKIGLGGFAVFQGSLDTPQAVPHRLDYMSPAWKVAFQGALDQAIRDNFEVSIAGSPGWSETGGPWVKPEEAMKKLVWSSMEVEGGQNIHIKLPPLPHSTGPFQNYQLQRGGTLKTKLRPLPEFVTDAAIVAYRIPNMEHDALTATVTASNSTPDLKGTLDAGRLQDGDIQTPAITLSQDAGQTAWVLFDYQRQQEVQAVSLATTDDIASFFGHDDPHPVAASVEATDDGEHFRHLADIPHSSIPQRTVAFPATSARYFRVSFPARETTQTNVITELALQTSARMNQWESRSGYATVPDYFAIPDVEAQKDSVVRKADVINLTDHMQSDGSLDWQAPEGHWRVLRMGQSLVGRENEPAPAEATGLEVDKLNAEYVRKYIRTYLATYRDTVGISSIGKHGITYLLTDSIEVGSFNWTDTMLADFERLRGYDARPWLPALTGVVIGSTVETDRFLWDFRRTIAQLFAQNHYAVIADEVHREGLGYYSEALEFRRPSLGDDMEMRSHADIPMAAMWTFSEKNGPNPTYIADIRGAASIAHVYGQNLVAAESMTAGPPPWSWSPNSLKRVADMEFALGVNRMHIHESTHQPLIDKAPGLTLGPYGQWFNRNETWADSARPWIDYLSRSSYLLQQGHYFADVAYFYGEEAPLTSLFGVNGQTDAPEGYAFDFVNADVLLHRMIVDKGILTTGTGTRYRVLYLGGDSQRMTLPVLRRLQKLVQDGAVVVGARPQDSPSLADDQAEFSRIADALWVGTPLDGALHVGRGRIYPTGTVEDVLQRMHVPRDFEEASSSCPRLMFLHRQTASEEIYFVVSRSDQARDIQTSFRIAGRKPELWDATTGTRTPLAYSTENSVTQIPLHLDPYGAMFVVFREPGPDSLTLPVSKEQALLPDDALSGGWHVSFPPDRGAPASALFEHLTPWNESADAGIRYFSGTATYIRDVEVSASSLQSGGHIWLDLGQVRELASVTLNGKDLGVAWKTPYRLDATAAIHDGTNHLQIQATNLWVNRLIGDAQPNAEKKYTFTTFVPYKATDPLQPSGLIGPVRLIQQTSSPYAGAQPLTTSHH